MQRLTRLLVVSAMIAAFAAIAVPAGADDGPALYPAEVDEIIFPGSSLDVTKEVHTPDLPPVLDMCLVVDLSGSYFNDLPNIKAVAPTVWDNIVAGGVGDLRAGLATFVDFPYSPWGASTDYAYRLDQDLTADKATWVAAVNAMSTLNGGDFPESQYEALFQLATGAGNDVPDAPDDDGDIAPGQQCTFREDATKVAIMTTDAPFHNAGDPGTFFPYPGASAADTTTALVDAGIKVIGIKAPGAGGELDALAAATGGTTVPSTSTSSDIAEAILSALEAITVDVSMTSDCEYPIDTSFAPDSVEAAGGDVAVFTETISVAGDAPGGVYTCRDWAMIDGEPMVDASGAIVYESKRILVPENFVTGGGNITNGEKGKNRANILTFGGNAGYMADGSIVGHWTWTLHDDGVKIQTTEITALQFRDDGFDPAPPEADADTAVVTATARVDSGDGWEEGCVVVAAFQDRGEPQEDVTAIIDLTCPSGVFYDPLFLNGGNIQIHDGTKD